MDDLHVALMKVIVPIATFFGWAVDKLPSIAAAVSIAWMVYQWYHSEPMKQRRRRRRPKGTRK